MSNPLTVVFLDSNSLYIRLNINSMIHIFLENNFQVDEIAVAGQPIDEHDLENRLDELHESATKAKEISFRAYNPQMRFEIRTHVGWGEQHFHKKERVWVSGTTYNTPYFWVKEFDPEKYTSFFLGFAKSLYSALLPDFGWIDFEYGMFTTHENIEAFELLALYWANFFGASYVNRIGKEKILGAPAWKIEALPDGGLLYILADSPGLTANHVDVEDVKKYFIVEKVR